MTPPFQKTAQNFQEPVVLELGKTQVDIAVLQTQHQHLIDTIARLSSDMALLATQVSEMRAMMNEAKGGWRVMMMIGGAAAGVGGAVVWLLQHVRLSP
jgi:hypothetical protein